MPRSSGLIASLAIDFIIGTRLKFEIRPSATHAKHPHAADLILADKIESRLLELTSSQDLPDDPAVLLDLLCRIRRQKLREETFAHKVKRQKQKLQVAKPNTRAKLITNVP